MKNTKRFALLGALAIAGATGACNSFLTGGDLSTDPNRPVTGTAQARFEATQPALWSLLSSDFARINDIWVQYFTGGGIQYDPINFYIHDEATTNGLHQGIYTGGGLVDIRAVETQSAASGDSVLWGVAQVEEGLTMGTAADMFGDVVYTQALTNIANPTLDGQLDVYAHVQAVLDSSIVLLAARTPITNIGPGDADLSYGSLAGGSSSLANIGARWTALAHTLKARFYLHTAEVNPSAYQQAYDETLLGITDPDGDYKTLFSGNVNEQNQWYQFDVVLRAGYVTPSNFFTGLLTGNSDPRIGQYFLVDTALDHSISYPDLSDSRTSPTFTSRLVTAQENLLIAAEAGYRLGHPASEVLGYLNQSRAISATECSDETGHACVLPTVSGLTGLPLLHAVLTEKYIFMFQSIEAYNDYKRTCFPNVTPTVTGLIIPARWYYDTSERQTDTNIPAVGGQPTRNANDPANATDDFGVACKGQTP